MKNNLVCHVNSYFLSNHLHKHLVESLKGRKENFFQIVFVPVLKGFKFLKPEDEKSVKYLFSRCFTSVLRYLWPLKMMAIYSSFKKLIAKDNISIIHAHSLISNGLIAYLYSRKKDIPYIITIRNTDINIFLKKSILFRKLGILILKKAKAITFLSPAYRDVQLKKFISSKEFQLLKNKMFVIPNGIDDFWIQNTFHEEKNIETFEILFVGKLRKNKNLLGLIEACKILQSRNIPYRLNIAGDGVLKEKVLQERKEININYLGFISDKNELLSIYRNCQVMVVPSFKETFGLVYAEAMTQGLPVIYTKGQGFDGYFKEGEVGYAIEANKIDTIVEALIKVKQNHKEISKRAYHQSTFFSWNNAIEKISNLYLN